ncbi:MAG TPA: hypothetical protein VM347_12505 [Nonomuraea sp.]|nr:hypothetical protein [Nonomuraea sp.]
MSEMAQTADHLVVIGKGALIADTSVSKFVGRSSQAYVRVCSPWIAQVAELIRIGEPHGDHLRVTGGDAAGDRHDHRAGRVAAGGADARPALARSGLHGTHQGQRLRFSVFA